MHIEFQGEKVLPGEKMVQVEYVGNALTKDDCKHYTKTMWIGKGDIQPYPARLWPKLAQHPDVWRLVGAEAVAAPLPGAPALQAVANPELEALRLKLADTERQLAEATAAREAAERAAAEREAADAAEGPLTAEQLAAMSDEDVRAAASARKLGLHARLMPEKIRGEFLRLQDEKLSQAA